MHPEAQKNLENRILSIMDRAEVMNPCHRDSAPKFVSSLGNKRIFVGLKLQEALEFDKVVELLAKHERFWDRFSFRFLSNQIANLVLEILEDGNKEILPNRLNDLLLELERYNEECTVLLPIKGVSFYKFPEGKISIGKVLLKNLDQKLIREIKRELREEHNFAYDKQMEYYRSKKISAIVEYRANSEPIRARERAEEETRKALELLRFAQAIIYTSSGYNIGLMGETISDYHESIVYSDKSFIIDADRVIGTIDISEANVDKMREKGFFEFSEILRKSINDITEYEKTLLQAIHWFSQCQVHNGLESYLVNLMSCLETLLISSDEKSSISIFLPLRSALLGSQEASERAKIKKNIANYYLQRSKLVHGQTKIFVSERDIRYLLHIVPKILCAMVWQREKFRSKQQFLDAFNDKLKQYEEEKDSKILSAGFGDF